MIIYLVILSNSQSLNDFIICLLIIFWHSSQQWITENIIFHHYWCLNAWCLLCDIEGIFKAGHVSNEFLLMEYQVHIIAAAELQHSDHLSYMTTWPLWKTKIKFLISAFRSAVYSRWPMPWFCCQSVLAGCVVEWAAWVSVILHPSR